MVKAVIFDLDGVLVDTEVFSGQATKQVFKEAGIEFTPEEREKAFGRTDLEISRDAVKSRGLDLKPEDLVSRKVQIYSELIKGKVEPIKGARELVEFLKSRGIPFAVASSGTPDKIRATFSEIGFEGLFDIMVTAEDISRCKPDPEIFLKAAEKLGIPPEECLVIEDAQAGVEAAKAAGMKCLALKSPSTYGQDLSQADRIINSLEEAREEF